ncbi:WXG100 family type VII secretion target [Mycolicibacterium sp. 120266]|uniref:WXG100 family type VII secretion target n=1 Tax=Mycolicibacterium sp. 120266 TaxID=3090601 RepID=UPI00299D62D0|nr:WXG100 family type VII secretion target [Mycolicibacterium sp. 120266]MDX1870699.1 WXG100 family type VII secretion target [Mycolicibacterium sp. 120266]
MPTFQYDLAEMSDFLDLIDDSIEQIGTHLDTARATVSTLLEQYSGSAADAFTHLHQDWQDKAQQHLTELGAFRAYVATARDNYADALRANLDMFGT